MNTGSNYGSSGYKSRTNIWSYQGWLGIIVFFILVLGLLIITLAINRRNVFLKHVSWFYSLWHLDY